MQHPGEQGSGEMGPERPSRAARLRHPLAISRRAALGSLVLHGATLLVLTLGGGLPVLKPVPVVIPVAIVAPQPTPTPRPRPRAQGDLPVRPRHTPAPTPTPTPRPTPMAKPSPRPSATPTPRPTMRPTTLPTPPATRREAEQFAKMRRIPYFAKMTDAQLRQFPMPPGLKDWGEVERIGKQLDGLQWLFLPPETGIAASPDAHASTALWAPDVPGVSPLPWPSPQVSTDPDGQELWAFQVQDVRFTVLHAKAAVDVEVRPERAATETLADPAASPTFVPAGEAFQVPWQSDLRAQMQGILGAWFLRQQAPSPSPPAP
ncbi:MAG: hypothetical protein VKP62_10490 [Candidatus Sericytochromatia bacterium]|nr:hypothetical protein [Candidatus Sericytochromatia bacterium]